MMITIINRNKIIGSKINAYINLGFLLNWQLAAGWQLTTGIDLSHFSNGNTHVPQRRRQYRWRQDRSGAHLQSKCRDGDDRQADHTTHQTSHQLRHRLIRRLETKGVIKPDEAYLAPGSFGVLGFNFNPMYNFHQYFRAGASLDVQYDESANIKEYEADYNDQAEHRFTVRHSKNNWQSGYPYGANWSCRSSRSM